MVGVRHYSLQCTGDLFSESKDNNVKTSRNSSSSSGSVISRSSSTQAYNNNAVEWGSSYNGVIVGQIHSPHCSQRSNCARHLFQALNTVCYYQS